MRPKIGWIRSKIWKGVFAGQALQFEPTIEPVSICSLDIDNNFLKILFSRMHDRKLTDFCLNYQKAHLQIQLLKSSPTSSLYAYPFLRYRLYSENISWRMHNRELIKRRSKIWKGTFTGLELSFEPIIESVDKSVFRLWTKTKTWRMDRPINWMINRRTGGQTNIPNL